MKLEGPTRILFVGDSLTYVNDLDKQVASLALSADAEYGKALTIDRAVRGGAPLKVLWKKSDARKMINSGRYDLVVLQEDLPETNVADFEEFAAKFHAVADAAGSKVMFLATWPYKRLNWIWTDGILEAHRKVASELGGKVAPAAASWQVAEKDLPRLQLYAEDAEHPSMVGTYLAALVVFAAIWGVSPVGIKYVPLGTSLVDEEIKTLQKIAWMSTGDGGIARQPAEQPSGSAEVRDELVQAAFDALDSNGAGGLRSADVMRFADFMGYAGSYGAWLQEYAGLCGAVGRAPNLGVSIEGFRAMVDGNVQSLTLNTDCSDGDLRDLVAELTGSRHWVDSGARGHANSLERVVIVPGNGCTHARKSNWYGWLADCVEKLGVEVGICDMPDPDTAKEDVWLPFIVRHLAGGAGMLQRTLFVGHSSGAAALMRLSERYRLGGVVLVSAYTSDLGDHTEKASGYFGRQWKWDRQRANCQSVVQFASTDDPFLPLREQRTVRDGLCLAKGWCRAFPSRYIELEARSHFFRYPFEELLDVVKEFVGSPRNGM